MNDILNLVLILFVVLKIVDTGAAGILDIAIAALLLVNAALTLSKRFRK